MRVAADLNKSFKASDSDRLPCMNVVLDGFIGAARLEVDVAGGVITSVTDRNEVISEAVNCKHVKVYDPTATGGRRIPSPKLRAALNFGMRRREKAAPAVYRLVTR